MSLSKGAPLGAMLLWMLSQTSHAAAFKNQTALDQFASQAQLEFALVSNFQAQANRFALQIRLNNNSQIGLPAGKQDWQLYFHSVRKLEQTVQHGLLLEHIQGDLHRVTPTATFAGLAPTKQLTLDAVGGPWMVSFSDFMPRAFVVSSTLKPAVFANTDTEQLAQFVAPFRRPEQQLRFQQPEPDRFAVITPALRFARNKSVAPELTPKQLQQRIIPAPRQLVTGQQQLTLTSQWQIFYPGELSNEAKQLQQGLTEFNLPMQLSATARAEQQIRLQLSPDLTEAESYQLHIDAKGITIRGADPAGVFYGVQSLLSLASTGPTLWQLHIDDGPRYHWRGMHYDMARNFHGVEVTKRLIAQMARYKLNKLHLHLTEDEGWRLEIPGLPELTDVGAYRCFDLTEQRCLLTQLGTGPHREGSGNGYYSRQEFIDLLKFASAHHVEIIPEIDMPGHARAAVKAMQARYHRLQAEGKTAEAKRYLLSDPADQSRYLTVQNYNDNSVNVCLDSSYAFIDKVVYELQQMYREAGLRLQTYHMGGDEVGQGSWTESPACQQLLAKGEPGLAGIADLKPYFVSKVADLLAKRQLNLGGWEDGLMYDANTPFNRQQFANPSVYANVWDNIWEWGVADRAYRLANAGYQVVLSHGTHLYFDHPYEVHPEERGYYWAARFTDVQKIFNYMPDALYANADFTRTGETITDLSRLLGRPLPRLEKPENILGIQGQVWSETIRTASQLEEMVYPRLLPLAERAWHQASWEQAKPDAQARQRDWQQFNQTLAQKELPRLAKAGVQFYIPPPGADWQAGQLQVNTSLPGLSIEYSSDQGQHWQPLQEGMPPTTPAVRGQGIWLRTKAPDGRVSRTVELP